MPPDSVKVASLDPHNIPTTPAQLYVEQKEIKSNQKRKVKPAQQEMERKAKMVQDMEKKMKEEKARKARELQAQQEATERVLREVELEHKRAAAGEH